MVSKVPTMDQGGPEVTSDSFRKQGVYKLRGTEPGNGTVAANKSLPRRVAANLMHRIVVPILGMVLALSSVGATFAQPASAQVSGGAYVHPVECRTGTTLAGTLASPWLPWYTTWVRVRPFIYNGGWQALDAVTDYAGWQDFKYAYLGTNGNWYYPQGSTRSGASGYSRIEMAVGHQPKGTPFLPRGFHYWLEYQYLDNWTGTWKSVNTATCFMY
jgi:hypothetical protein